MLRPPLVALALVSTLALALLPGLALAQDPAPAPVQDAAAPDAAAAALAEQPDDPYLWLEDVEGDKALDWSRARNAESVQAHGQGEEFEALQTRLLEIFDASDRIPRVTKIGDLYYNLWKDADNPRGLWRRTTLQSWSTDEPEWEPVLDLDALGAAEDENWVWGSVDCRPPTYERCLMRLSRGGADAKVVREFDLTSKSFVTKKPFELPEAKQRVSWIDKNTLFVATDFGEGSLTDSGYPRIIKVWKRGTPISKAKTVLEGEATDVSVGGWHDATPGFERELVYRALTFYEDEVFLRTKRGLEQIEKPADSNLTLFREHLLLELRSDWTVGGKTFEAGSLVGANFEAWQQGERDLQVLFEPTDAVSLRSVTTTKNHVILTLLDMVASRLDVLTFDNGAWTHAPLPGVPDLGTLYIDSVDALESDAYWLTITDFLTPTSIAMGSVGGGAPETLKQRTARFDASGLVASQHVATSDDGTKVPYFQVGPKDTTLDGSNPTLLYGYGGFEVSLLPRYSATRGITWLEKGGVYVVANIRGGGEFGPSWHQAALKDKRHRAYEDFAAVAEDLVTRGVTSHQRLGCEGGSNGGLLAGNMYTLYPDRFGAVLSEVPLLDMRRYSKLLAGASWMGEYGDPDVPEQWEFIKTFSPYHNVDPAAEHPPILITTSTRDDRVHPAHARKMVARLLELDKDVTYFENIEGGHGGAADNKQASFLYALQYTWMWDTLTKPAPVEAQESSSSQ